MSDISPSLHAEVVRRADHFRWERERAVPLTSTGRATVAALAMNRPLIVAIRQEETARGRHPPT
jgi:hypothetical protein